MTRRANIPLSPILDDDLLGSWELSLQAANKSPLTLSTYQASVNAFRGFLSPTGVAEDCSTRVADITQEVCQRFVAHLLETRKSKTAQTRYQGLYAFFRWCVDEELLEDSPMRKLHKPQDKDRPSVLILSDEQMSALLGACRADKTFAGFRDLALLRLLPTTGMRRAECAALELEDIDLGKRIVHIRHGKGGKARYASLDVKTAQALDRYIKRVRVHHTHSYLPNLWIGQQGALTPKGINFIVAKRAREAGLEHIHPHLFRHLATHEFLAQEMQVNNVAELLGHTDLNMIMQTYGRRLANKRAIEEHQRLHIGDRW